MRSALRVWKTACRKQCHCHDHARDQQRAVVRNHCCHGCAPWIYTLRGQEQRREQRTSCSAEYATRSHHDVQHPYKPAGVLTLRLRILLRRGHPLVQRPHLPLARRRSVHRTTMHRISPRAARRRPIGNCSLRLGDRPATSRATLMTIPFEGSSRRHRQGRACPSSRWPTGTMTAIVSRRQGEGPPGRLRSGRTRRTGSVRRRCRWAPRCCSPPALSGLGTGSPGRSQPRRGGDRGPQPEERCAGDELGQSAADSAPMAPPR